MDLDLLWQHGPVIDGIIDRNKIFPTWASLNHIQNKLLKTEPDQTWASTNEDYCYY